MTSTKGMFVGITMRCEYDEIVDVFRTFLINNFHARPERAPPQFLVADRFIGFSQGFQTLGRISVMKFWDDEGSNLKANF